VPESHRFGQVEVQVTERTVRVDGHAAPLGARAFDILLALIEHRDRVVTKNELLDSVWPGLVVEENNLAVQVSALRRVLGPQTIATVPGRGYRFAAPLVAAAPAAPAAQAVPVAAPTGPPAPPAPAGPLLGRDDDLVALARLLHDSRLVTLVGAGGIGKTSLALALAHLRQGSCRDGVAWVSLSELADPQLVPRAVSQAAGLPAVAGDEALPALAEALRPLQMLLVLDNAEHLLDGVQALVGAIALKAPEVQLLVTSQAVLKLDGEHVFRLGPLSLPAPDAPLAEAEAHGAVALFAEQARAADRRFALTDANVGTVVALCRHLDGTALAIKLAAARLPLLGLQGLAARLSDRLKLLGGGSRSAPARQQTLRAALDWSHGLLDPEAQLVFRRLGVFAGGFTLDTAAAVAGGGALDEWQVIDVLGELVDRSLVEADAGPQPRYRMLETAREYARLQLDEAHERETIQERHAQALAALMDAAYEAYWGSADKAWLEAFEPEIDNVRLALAWSTLRRPDLALRLAGSASVGFLLTGQAPEARRFTAALDGFAAGADATPALARYWLERSRLHWGISGRQMHDFALRAAALSRAAGDARGLYLALRCAVASGASPAAEASAVLDEMGTLEQPGWPPRLRSQRLLAHIGVLNATGRTSEARSAGEGLLSLARAASLDSVAAVALVGLAAAQLALDEPEQALRSARSLLAAPGARRGNFVLPALATAAHALLRLDEAGPAREAVAELIAASRSRNWEWFGLSADLFALLAVAEGRFEAAARLLGRADAAYRSAGLRGANPARARAQVLAAVAKALAPAALERLLVEGERMDDETVCAMTLG